MLGGRPAAIGASRSMTSHDRDGARRRVRLQRARAVTTALAGGSVIGVLILADLAAHSTPARASAVPSTPSATPTGSPGSTPATGATQPAAADPTTIPTTVAPATNPAPASTAPSAQATPPVSSAPATPPVSSAPAATSPAMSSPYIQSGSGSSGYATYSPPVPSYSPTPVRSGAS